MGFLLEVSDNSIMNNTNFLSDDEGFHGHHSGNHDADGNKTKEIK